MRSTKVSKNRSIWGSRGARPGVQSIVFGVPYGLRKWSHVGPYKIVAYLGFGPNLDRIAETAHTRVQDGAMLGSNTNFYRDQDDFQNDVMLGPYKIFRSQSRGSPKVT